MSRPELGERPSTCRTVQREDDGNGPQTGRVDLPVMQLLWWQCKTLLFVSILGCASLVTTPSLFAVEQIEPPSDQITFLPIASTRRHDVVALLGKLPRPGLIAEPAAVRSMGPSNGRRAPPCCTNRGRPCIIQKSTLLFAFGILRSPTNVLVYQESGSSDDISALFSEDLVWDWWRSPHYPSYCLLC
jgi:hypothetical protein